MRPVKTVIFTGMALVAFAANSVLCRLALKSGAIDASGFTLIRLLSGAVVLFSILSIRRNKSVSSTKGSWAAGLMLFLYVITFSFAYRTLDTGTGALILFGSVQITMILLSLVLGDRIHISEWVGTAVAFFGFVYLVLPGAAAPSAVGFLLMTVSGIAWGVYTLWGRGSKSPLSDTAYNFLRAIPLVLIIAIAALKNAHYSPEGILLASISGGIASGIGYAIWYAALGGLSATQAAVVQLLVPVLAAFGGVVLVSEGVTLRLIVSAAMILGGVLMVSACRYYFVQVRPNGGR